MIIIGTPHTKGAGYYMNDDRGAGGAVAEADIRTCPHCQAIIKMQEWRKAQTQGFCTKCMQPTCSNPACMEFCTPFIEIIERMASQNMRFVMISRTMGLDPVSPPSLIVQG